MPESVKDLTVRLAFEHGDTKSQVSAIRNEIKLLETDFAAAAAAAGGFSAGLNESQARGKMLEQQIELQRMAVEKYGTAIEKEQKKIQSAQERQKEYNQKLDEAKARHDELTAKKEKLAAAMQAEAAANGESSAAYQEMKAAMAELNEQISQNETAMKGWERGIANADKQMANADKNIQKYTAAQNEARAAIGRMEQALSEQQRRVKAHADAWEAAEKKLRKYADTANTAGKRQQDAGKKLSRVSAAIGYAGVTAAQAAIEWEDAFAGVRKTVSGTEEQLKGLEDALLNMKVPTDYSDLADIAANAGQLGIATDNVAGFTRTMADLAETTNLSAEEGASAFAKFANITGMAQTEFDRMGSAVVELGNNTATTEKDIVAMATGIASAGHQVGMTEAQILGVSAGLSSLGLEAQAGGTAFSKLLINMQVAAETGSDELKKFADVAGMTGEQFKQAFQADAASAVTQFIQGLSTGSQSAIAILDEMGVKETRFRDMLLRTANASGLFTDAIGMATSAWDQNTALATEAAVRYDTTASRMKMLGKEAQKTAMSFGESMMPYVEKGMEGISKLVDGFNKLDKAQRDGIVTAGLYAAAIGPGLSLIGKANTFLGGAASGLANFAKAMAEGSGGVTGLMGGLKELLGPAGMLAVAGAAMYGAYAFIDWASGAKAAREATEALNTTAQEWLNTQAKTIYDSGNADPLAMFGLSKADFAGSTQATKDWFDSLVTTWTDGKRETNDIVKQFTDGFTEQSEGVREAIEGQKTLLEGYEALTPDAKKRMDADLKQLDAWDKEVSALLKKRQNGKLSDADQQRLNEILQARTELEISYKLDKGDGYDQIITQMQADVARAQAGGELGDNYFGDTMNALAEGRKAYNDALADSYRQEYASIQAIEDETARTQALSALDEQYRQRRQEGEEAYHKAVLEAGKAALQEGDYSGQIDQIDQLMAELGKGEDIDLPKLNELTEGLDEGQLTSLITLMEQMKEAGATETDFSELGMSYDGLIEKLTAIRDLAKGTEGAEGLADMIGKALPEEVQRIMIGLDMTQAAADWAAFAEGGSLPAIKAQVEVEEVDASTIAVTGAIVANGKLGTVTGEDGKTYKVTGATVNADGTLKTVTAENGKTYTVDNATVKADGTLGTVTGEDGRTYAVSGVKAKVDGALDTITGEDGRTYKVTGATVKADGTLDTITGEDGRTYKVSGATVKADGTLATVTAEDGKTYKVNGATVEVNATAKVRLNPLDKAAITNWEQANSGVTLNGPAAKVSVKLGDNWQTKIESALAAGTLTISDSSGVTLPVTPETVKKITATDVAMLGEDGTIHVVITPEVGSPEGVEMATEQANHSELDGTILSFIGSSANEDVQTINNLGQELNTLRERIDAVKKSGEGYDEFGNSLGELGNMETGALTAMTNSLMALSETDLSAIASEAANLMAALASGELSEDQTEQAKAQLQAIADMVGNADQYLGTGNNVSAGIAEGMKAYGWEGDAATVATGIQTAINAALGAHSPATTMIPTGSDVSEGIGKGATDYSFSGDAGTVAGNLQSALSAAMASGTISASGESAAGALAGGMSGFDYASTCAGICAAITGGFSGLSAQGQSIGSQFGSGLSAGLSAKLPGIVAQAKAAANRIAAAFRQAWQIHSPSRVAENLTTMFGEGLEKGMDKWPTVSRRMLEDDMALAFGYARSAGQAVGQTTNNNNNSVNMNIGELKVNDRQDAEELAYQINGLGRRSQRSRGLR